MEAVKIFEIDSDNRICAFYDENAPRPFDSYGPPIIQVPFIGPYVHNISLSDDKYADYVRNFVSYHGKDFDLLERALRIVFGATCIKTFDGQDSTYIVFDPKEEFPGYANHIRKNVVHGYATEYESWVNGECFWFTFERRLTGKKVYDNGRSVSFEEWESYNSVSGFYGTGILDDKSMKSLYEDYRGFDESQV